VATLGFVEVLLHMISEYYEKYDAAKKQVFGDVHFLLFYTAIINAFQTVVTASVTLRVAQTQWVTTELLELNHYVELREEFDVISRELLQLHQSTTAATANTASPANDQSTSSHYYSARAQPSATLSTMTLLEDPLAPQYEISRRSVVSFWQFIQDSIRYPTVRRKYDALLAQVRFHELRMHFLTSYELPLTFPISNYLLRCKHNVLLGFVNVSSTAWLLLTAGVCLLYYILGMVYYNYLDQALVGHVLTFIFFGSVLVSSVALWVVSFKMHAIFNSLMHNTALWNVHGASPEEKRRLAAQQMALFWVAEPKNVLDFVQFLQFGYGLAISTVVVFWEEINDGDVGMHWFVIVVSLGYAHFVNVTGKIIPMYILCTSLGQLVDERVLHATVALHRLDEEKQRQLELVEFEKTEADGFTSLGEDSSESNAEESLHPTPQRVGSEDTNRVGSSKDAQSRTKALSGINQTPRRRHRRKASSDGVAAMASVREELGNSSDSIQSLSEALSKDSSVFSLTVDSSDNLSIAERRARFRHERKKSLSDGVAIMARMSQSEDSASSPLRPSQKPKIDRARARKVDTGDMLAKLVSSDTTELRTFLQGTAGGHFPAIEDPRRQRMHRQKSVSDGVSSMRNAAASAWVMNASKPVDALVRPHGTDGTQPIQQRHARTKSLSDGAPAMASLEDHTSILPASSMDEGLAQSTDLPRQGLNVSMNGVSHDESLTFKEPQQSVASGPVLDRAPNRPLFMDGPGDAERGFAVVSSQHGNEVAHRSSSEMLYAYFLGKQHVLVSNVFGTIAAFFMVGQRIEGFIYHDDIEDHFVSLHLPLTVSFWILASLLTNFLIASGMVFYLFRRMGNGRSINELKVVLAAAIDSFIAMGCLVVLFVSEYYRCCRTDAYDVYDAHRGLGEKADGMDGLLNEEYRFHHCTCPAFGHRISGGLGNIEPYTSLVLLRLIRHWVARRLVVILVNVDDLTKMQAVNDSKTHGHAGVGPSDHSSRPVAGSHSEVAISIVEAWEATLEAHPDLVAAHGEFSGEILRAMLGVRDAMRTPLPPAIASAADAGRHIPKPKMVKSAKSFSVSKEYAGLSAEAQEVILAGKLGRSLIKATSGNVEDAKWHPSTIHEDAEKVESPLAVSALLFEIDAESHPVAKDVFLSAPNARLICSMRRCDRKFLPILNKWAVVDVAMTRFEILYFDAVGVDEILLDNGGEGTRQAVIATKGGEGLRICDVAVGRRIVGRLSIADVSTIHVERISPNMHEAHKNDHDSGIIEVVQTEFWMRPLRGSAVSRTECRTNKWSTLHQDLLTIETVHGHTLFLRFYSDFERCSEQLSSMDLCEKDEHCIAFQWAQQIGRLCGKEQLRNQQLPHFCDGTLNELRDYLLVTAHKPSEGKGRLLQASSRRSQLKRNKSYWNV
jgi:hypothetical protein